MTSTLRTRSTSTRWRTAAAWLPLSLMLLPPVRSALESSMTAHMLIQFPCLMLGGALIVQQLPAHWLSGAQRWNELGIAGLVGVALALTVLMIPRVLDLALVDARVEVMKLIALVLVGAVLRRSWRRAGAVIQAFFLGNMLPMMVVIGMLLQESGARVCNAYRLADQQTLGSALVVVASATAALWLLQVARRRTIEIDGESGR